MKSWPTLSRPYSAMTLQLMIGRLRIRRWSEAIVDFSLQNTTHPYHIHMILPIRLDTPFLTDNMALKVQRRFIPWLATDQLAEFGSVV